MERESFENQQTADFLNAHFVSIKVDREERPDVDKIYMTAVQAMSGQGGWPLNCFLTPDLKPFYGGTYFPPEDKYGHASFGQVLRQIAKLWETRRGQVLATAGDFHQKLEAFTARQPSDLFLSPALLANAAAIFKREYDRENGGFGGAPKFPRPSEPAFLLRYALQAERSRGGENGPAHLRPDGGGRHPRPDRRRFFPLFGRCALAGAAFRENAL